MDKILEALSKLLPETDVQEVAEAVKAELDAEKERLEQEYSEKLSEAYEEMHSELKDTEQTALEGYNEAVVIIEDLRKRLETQQVEFDSAMNDGFEEAYQMLEAEKEKNASLEEEMLEHFNGRLLEMKEYFTDKITDYLEYKCGEIYDEASRKIMNDPRMVEHKLVLDKVVKELSGYLGDERYASVVNNKVQELEEKVSDLTGKNKILESRSIKLDRENHKLNEAVRLAQNVIREANNDKKERVELTEQVTGRGRSVSDDQVEVIKEHDASDKQHVEDNADTTLIESMSQDEWKDLNVLAGMNKVK